MAKDVRVIIVEEDLYSRDMLTMLLTRDWRTRIVGHYRTVEEAWELLSQPFQSADVLLLGLETPGEARLLPSTTPGMSNGGTLHILYVGTGIDMQVQPLAERPDFGGYVLKEEIYYSIASAVALTARGHCVITPGVRPFLRNPARSHPLRVLDGMRKMGMFSRREAEIIHLGILLNMPQRDIADELLLGRDWISEAVSNVYAKLGVHDLLAGVLPLELYFEDEAVIGQVKKILERVRPQDDAGRSRKAPWMSTLAFHLLTVPHIEEIP